jgi:hypothetical protein
MTARLCLSFILLVWVVGPFDLCLAEEWTNFEGKTIEASFVRLALGGSAVVLRQGEKVYEVGLNRLSEESKNQALRLQEKKAAWARQELLKPLFSEEVLLELAKFDRASVAGKQYLVEGRVVKILQPASISSTQPRLLFEFGTESAVDFSSLQDNRMKLRITADRVTLMRPDKAAGLRTYSEYMDLVKLGQLFVILGRVDDDTIAGVGIADEIEVRRAREAPRSVTFASYLANEPQLNLANVIGTSAAPPESASPGPQINPLLQWLLSLIGQSSKPAEQSP